MLTIRHIHFGGDEEIIPVEAVRYTPASQMMVGAQGASGAPETVWIVAANTTGERPLTGGTIFIMNDAGKTVARYDLGASPVPIVGDGLNDPRHRGIGQGASIGERSAA